MKEINDPNIEHSRLSNGLGSYRKEIIKTPHGYLISGQDAQLFLRVEDAIVLLDDFERLVDDIISVTEDHNG